MAREQGLAQGLKKGEAVGFKKGATQEKREIAQNMLQEGMEKAVIAKITGLTLSELANL